LEKIGPLETNLLMPLSVVDWVAASLLAFAFLVQVIYYLTVMNRVGRFKPRFKSSAQPPVSVIVCAKNESDNLKQYLPLLMGKIIHTLKSLW
jgi:poly-beta-1,6-N-acetyl-D-glucosamine synthase